MLESMQEKLVKEIIKVLIKGKPSNEDERAIILNGKGKVVYNGYLMYKLYNRHHDLYDCSYVWFDKKVPNMGLLCVLLRDWLEPDYYDDWISMERLY